MPSDLRAPTDIFKERILDVMQLSLWDQESPKLVTIRFCSETLGVSEATIRNWVKTGYLSSIGQGYITLESLEQVQTKFIGKEKLVQRANKSHKEKIHDQLSVATLFLNSLSQGKTAPEKVGAEYEKSLGESYKNKEGIYYTPNFIVADLFQLNDIDISTATFCDPCCGSGNFIAYAADMGFKQENIFGYDVDPVAIEITRKRLYEKFQTTNSHIVCTDFLQHAINIKNSHKFDYIFTNPPWGKKLTKNERLFFKNHFGVSNSTDTCSLFLFSCLSLLKDNGYLGFLLPDSFFNIRAFEEIRKHILQYKIEKIIDYGKPFKGILSGAKGIIIRNRPATSKNSILCSNKIDTFTRNQTSFFLNPNHIFNTNCSSHEAETIDYLFNKKHITLKNNAKWGLGIVTGNNNKFISSNKAAGYIPVYKGSDVFKNSMKEPSCFVSENMSSYQQVPPLELFQAKEKLIYRFITSDLCFFYDTEQRYVLNSANILIPNNDFPIRTKILGDILNSRFMNWLFKKIFNTHRILRGDLESLPFYPECLSGQLFIESEYIERLNIKENIDGTFRIKN